MPEPDFKERARRRRQEIMAGAQRRLDAHQGGRAIVKYISSEVDALLIDLWRDIAGPACDQVDLVGVGGYGRSELCPHSDWDLLFLVPKSRHEGIDAAIQRFLQVLWDCGAS